VLHTIRPILWYPPKVGILDFQLDSKGGIAVLGEYEFNEL
jgi:hypothetical protein